MIYYLNSSNDVFAFEDKATTEQLQKHDLINEPLVYEDITPVIKKVVLNGQIVNRPDSDITAELNDIESQIKQSEAHKFLLNTDFYVVRFNETGLLIPQEIIEQRALARSVLDDDPTQHSFSL